MQNKEKITLSFLGSGVARYIGLGFVPTRVVIQNVHAADLARIEWDQYCQMKATACDGIIYGINAGAATVAAMTVGTGVSPYYGGDVIAASAATHLASVDFNNTYKGDQRGKCSAGAVTGWTLDTAGSQTGHFDKLVDTTYVNVGSPVLIRGTDDIVRQFRITAISNDGDAANDVTLDRDAATGDVVRIGYMYDLVAAPVGLTMPAGIYLAETAACNASNELCYIMAERD